MIYILFDKPTLVLIVKPCLTGDIQLTDTVNTQTQNSHFFKESKSPQRNPANEHHQQ